MKKKLFGLFSLLFTFVLTACGGNSETVQVGVVGEDNEVWEYVQEQLAEEGIEIELVTFSDYQTPNQTLANGDIDLNSFQTEIFMDDFNEDTGNNLTPIGETSLAPLGIYSEQIENVDELQEGDTVVIPNDASNEGRALRLLQTAGVLKVDPEAGYYPVIDDVTNNPLNLNLVAVAGNQTARSLEDAAASIINVGMAIDAGFIPSQDAIFLEPVNEDSAPYINVIVANPEEAENDIYRQIVEAYQTPEVADLIRETTQGSSIPVWELDGTELSEDTE